jgi:2-methylcitrate dehydratase PrpD
VNLTDTFIDGLVTRSQTVSPRVKEQAKKCLLDYLGVVLGGARYLKEKHPVFFEVFTKDQGDSSVFGIPQKTTATNAAMLNGFSAHVLELDDGHRHGMIHLGASINTAVLLAAEKEQLKYDNILCGIIMGYEVAVRCARALQPGHKVRGYHVSGTCGTIGSAMGVAFACGYDVAQMKATLACAVSSAAGVLEIQEEASEMKPYNVGRAAMDGLVSAQMGGLAMPGPDDVMGGKRGFLNALTDTPHPEHLTDFTNEDYAIEGIYQKVHAACRHCHPAIDATLDMRNDLELKPEQIEHIEVHTYKLAVGSHDHTQIRGISSAKLSTPYGVALAVVKGSAGYADYNEVNLDDYNIKALTRKVSVIEDENLTAQSPAVRGAKVIIYLKNGKSYEAPCLYPKGEPEHPLTKEELEAKFRGLAMYGGLTREDCDKMINSVWDGSFSNKKNKL